MDSPGMVSVNGGYLLNSVIILVNDVLLSRDNAVLLALAVHALPRGRRFQGILIGAAGVVAIRVLLTWFASNLLQTPFLKLLGGLIVLWIAVKVLIEEAQSDPPGARRASTLCGAVWMMLAADFTTSADNMLAAGGAAKGSLSILWLSLGISIPLVILCGGVLADLMKRFPYLAAAGAALVGKVGGEMIFTDPGIVAWFHLEESTAFRYVFQALCAAAVLALAYRLKRKLRDGAPPAESPGSDPGAP